MDYIQFCKNYFSITGIPTHFADSGGVLYSTLSDQMQTNAVSPVAIYPAEKNPEFRSLSPDIVYGSVQIESTGEYIFLGPVFSVPLTEELIRQFMREGSTPLDRKEELTEILASIPRLTHTQFCEHLVFLHQCLNNKEITVPDLLSLAIPNQSEQDEAHLDSIVKNMESKELHNTYYYEMNLYQHVRNGNVNELNEFLSSTHFIPKSGSLARTPLRHAKNLFITFAAKLGISGAIPGGVDIEKTYQLMDLYIQECEKLQSIESIHALQYSMLIDFCRRSGETKIPDGISPEVYICINYIRSHTNEPISVNDVAQQIHRSPSYIMKKFKTELGFTIGAFITRCKLEEAKSLLTYSPKSLAEISNYLCFSSQPHFQTLFKKQYHITPLEYRKKKISQI